MTAPALSLQAAMRAALVANPIIVAQVPASRITARHARPESFPAIQLGEATEVADNLMIDQSYVRIFSTIHVWTCEPALEQVKAIAHQVRKTLVDNPTVTNGRVGFRCNSTRFLRDPSGAHSHGVIEFEVVVEDVAE
jgi:hypothetical protein